MTSSNGNIFRVLGALCEGNASVISGFPSQRPMTRSFDVFFDLSLNKELSKQSRRDLRRFRAYYDVTVMRKWHLHFARIILCMASAN